MFPLIASAQVDSSNFVSNSIDNVVVWVNSLLPLMVGLAMLAFFYGIVKYIWGAAEGKEGAKTIMIWGVIAIAVMVSVWGLVGLLQGFIGVGTGSGVDTKIEIPSTGSVGY